jgi:hypothetical protein
LPFRVRFLMAHVWEDGWYPHQDDRSLSETFSHELLVVDRLL